MQRRGGRDRQRWRRTLDDGTFHRFVGPLARTRLSDGPTICAACDNPVAVHEGPVAPWRFDYLVAEVADALVQLGRGSTYTEVAERASSQAWNGERDYRRGPTTVVNGQLVADWLARFGPVVAAPHAETERPETVVLDSTAFTYTDRWAKTRSQLFCVLAAHGYPAGTSRGRLWALHACPRDNAEAWAELLRSLPGRPSQVVFDDDKAIRGGVPRAWPGTATPALHQCEHHLYVNARKAMAADAVPDDRQLHELLNRAFTSPSAWSAFEAEVKANNGRRALNRWVGHWTPLLATQLARRGAWPDGIPGHWASGAIEEELAVVKAVVGDRAWTLRNRRRMNLLLEQVRLRVNERDSAAVYAVTIRNHLLTRGGRPAHSVRIADPGGGLLSPRLRPTR